MIGQIAPLVQGGQLTRRILPLHVLGAVAGGAVAGITLAFAGQVLDTVAPSFQPTALRYGLPLVLLYGAAVDLGLPRTPTINTSRQTPGTWSCTLGPKAALFAWAVDLGLVVRTRLPFQSLLVLPFFAVVSGSLWTSILVMAVYGVAKAGAVLLGVGFAGDRFAGVSTVVNSRAPLLRSAVGATGLALAALLVLVS